MKKFSLETIDIKQQELQQAANVLKSEFFGLDEIIDKIITSISAWYTFPQLIQRPVIINLWGLTGVGKTHVVRRLVQLLKFDNKFVELQMDGISSSSLNYQTTISGILADSSIEEGVPGILLLDEFQRYRTVDSAGQDVKIERFQDVWMLLSDGQFAANSSMMHELEMCVAIAMYDDHSSASDESAETTRKNKKPQVSRQKLLYPYEARKYKKLLRLSESLEQIMKWTHADLIEHFDQAMREQQNLQIDYTKLLVFVSGNLDEAFTDAKHVDDCDTDADAYHERVKRINVTDIKTALAYRFKPEQISRLGNNHIIYPSMTRSTYQRLIQVTCDKYITSMHQITGIQFSVTPEALQVVYDNSVYPTQGTRPVFSSIHKIFSDGLVQIAFWAIKKQINQVELSVDQKRSVLIGSHKHHRQEVAIVLDVDLQRSKAGPDFKTLVAVHEASHGLVYALLNRKAPHEVKINTASFNGGYMLPATDQSVEIMSKQQLIDSIAVLYAGRYGEQLVFGPMHVTVGAVSDLQKATAMAAEYVNVHAMDGVAGYVATPNPGHSIGAFIPDISTNETIDNILCTQRDRATQLLTEHKPLFVRIVNRLLTGVTLSQSEFIELLPELDLSAAFSRVDAWKHFSE